MPLTDSPVRTVDRSRRSAVIQLTPAALDRHLQGMTDKFRSGVQGKVGEAIEQSVPRILVRGDGSLTIEARPGGLLGVDGYLGQVGNGEGLKLFGCTPLSSVGREWKLTLAGM
jgi:hypothetical protein